MTDKPYDGILTDDWTTEDHLRAAEFDRRLKDIHQEEAPDPNCVMQLQAKGDGKVIRIDACIRLRWVCAGGHDHRFRLTAWLCELVKGLQK